MLTIVTVWQPLKTKLDSGQIGDNRRGGTMLTEIAARVQNHPVMDFEIV